MRRTATACPRTARPPPACAEIQAGSFEEVPTSYQPLTDSLRQRDPIVDSREAFGRGDRRLLVFEAMGTRAPGLPDDEYALRITLGVRLLPFVSDMVTVNGSGTSHAVWQATAIAYAERYNHATLRLLQPDRR